MLLSSRFKRDSIFHPRQETRTSGAFVNVVLLRADLHILPFIANFTQVNNHIMYTTYHLSSAQDINADILDAIKAAFKSKPITIIVEEDEDDAELSAEMKSVLDQRLDEDEKTYISAEESISRLNKKYGL
jgi:hypothetical protein